MMGRSATRLAAAGLGLAALWAVEARAQADAAPEAIVAADAAGVIAYPQAFFRDYQPASALDMVNRVPGFTYTRGDDVRGFAGAAGNVLIDGERPSSKAVNLDDVLRRIPVDSVERIDLIRGGLPGIDMQGQPVIANVIRRRAASSTVALDGSLKHYGGRPPGAVARLEASRRSGALSLEGAASFETIKQEQESGVGSFDRVDRFGALISSGKFVNNVQNRILKANGSAEYARILDQFRLNLGVERNETPRSERYTVVSAARPTYLEAIKNDLLTERAEVGGDYERELGGGVKAQLIALHTHRTTELVSSSVGLAAPQVSTNDGLGKESILRGVLSGVSWRGMAFEAGAEGALNSLDSRSTLTVGGTPVAIPSANVKVSERRGEGFVTVTAKPWAALSVEAGLRVEASTIRQSGDVDRARTFRFPKPRLILAYAVNPATQLRFRAERRVGQLNFQDFAATGDLISGTVVAGNVDLVPERAWVLEGVFERRFWGRGALVVTYTHQEIQDALDRIAVITPARVFDAPGNIGDARRDELKVNFTLPMERVGLRGGQLRGDFSFRWSEVTDPVTGDQRELSSFQATQTAPFWAFLRYSQDLPAWNSTFEIGFQPITWKQAAYRVAERRLDGESSTLRVFWDWKPRPSTQIRFSFDELNTKERYRRRELYSPTRAAGAPIQVEKRRTEIDPVFTVRVRQTL